MGKVVLVHGFNKDYRDMGVLGHNLEALGYQVTAVDLPLRFKSIIYCTELLEEKLEEHLANLAPGEKLNLIGHSTGGLIIRNYLARRASVDKIGRCVLIATPNKGSFLADICVKVIKPVAVIYKTIESLTTQQVANLKLRDPKQIEIGAIAGNKNNLILGLLLKGENDGRVEVKSVEYTGLKDFIIVPYGHKEIHYQLEVGTLVDNFIKQGTFR